MDVSQWQMAAPMYNGMKISNGVRNLQHKTSQTTDIAQQRMR
jgi:hypothetical protein